ncbi:uncharacterized protein [Diadema setosum]|uniref:uncharacterized protein n=1 Tax=Diadema setosum TaxID=31175 RepID=UPI003B3BC4B6
MPTVKESVCCKEIARVVEKMDSFAGDDLDCITMHLGFKTIFAWMNMRNRHVAYRQLARWRWRFLGRSVWVPLPSSAVNMISKTSVTRYNKMILKSGEVYDNLPEEGTEYT